MKNILGTITFVIFLTMGWPGEVLAIDAQAQEHRVDALSQFFAANQAYKDGDYQKAIDVYGEIVKAGSVSGPVYYNLGNSYFKSGKLGQAILNYERARRLTPRDSDLESNYSYALSQMKSYENVVQEPLVNRIVSQYSYIWTLDEVTLLLFVLFFLGGAIYLGGLFWKWPPGNSVPAIVIVCVLFVLHAGVFSLKLQDEGILAVVTSPTQAKFEPREDATNYFELAEGWKVTVLREDAGWVKIKRPDGKVGWAKRGDLEKI